MKYTKCELVSVIKKIVYEVTNIIIEDEKTNLLDNKLDIHPADFLYIFDLLEKELQVPVTNILRVNDFTVMRVDNMGNEILKLF